MHTTRSARYRRAKEAAKPVKLTKKQRAENWVRSIADNNARQKAAERAYKKPAKPNRQRRRPHGVVWQDGEGYDIGTPTMRRSVAECRAWRAEQRA